MPPIHILHSTVACAYCPVHYWAFAVTAHSAHVKSEYVITYEMWYQEVLSVVNWGYKYVKFIFVKWF